jgi:CubicO group peptidase (beta-lactamase class C family)
VDLHGTCDSRFDAVRNAFVANFDPGRAVADVGASVAVTVEGELVVDLWAGTVDTDAAATGDGTGAPWQRDTIVNVWSNSKTVAALACLILADQHELDLYAPVARVWPQFAANGKAGVLVRHVLSHTAGLPAWEPAIQLEDLYDWDAATAVLAAMAPWWEPGTASGYHAVTQGFLVGEIVRRVTGQTIGEFVRDEICEPVGADFHIGLAPDHDGRVGHVIPPPTLSPTLDDGSIAARAMRGRALSAAPANTRPWRRAEIPAAGGHGNARALAMIHAPMACGGTANGVTLLSSTGSDPVFDEQIDGVDLVLGTELRHGIGFGLPAPSIPLPRPRSCYWGGWGGSLTVVDVDARATFSYVMNRMAPSGADDTRAASLLLATLIALGDR